MVFTSTFGTPPPSDSGPKLETRPNVPAPSRFTTGLGPLCSIAAASLLTKPPLETRFVRGSGGAVALSRFGVDMLATYALAAGDRPAILAAGLGAEPLPPKPGEGAAATAPPPVASNPCFD